MLLAAGLIRRFGTISREEVCEKALKCFEGLLAVLDSQGSAGKISSMIDRQVPSVQKTAELIIDHLLFNVNDDPYLSLGLTRDAGKAEVNKRWKRLIVLYHPDRYPDKKEYEEKAKKINEVYDKIRKIKEHGVRYGPVEDIFRDVPPPAAAVHHARYLRYLPTLILALTIFIAIISILLFFKAAKDDRHKYDKNQGEWSRPAGIRGSRTPALTTRGCPSCRTTAACRIL